MNTILLSENTILLSESPEPSPSLPVAQVSAAEQYWWADAAAADGLPPSAEEALQIQFHPAMQAALMELQTLSQALLHQIRDGG